MHNGVGKMPTISLRTIIWSLLLVFIILSSMAQAQDNGRPPAVYYSDWSQDGSTIAVATNTNTGVNELTIYNADLSVRSVWQRTNSGSMRIFAGLSPNGDRILTEGEVWDTSTFEPTLIASDYYLGDWSADGALILAVPKSELGFVTLSSTTGQVIQSYSEGIYNMNGPVWSPNNRFFVNSDPSGMIYVIDSQTGAVIAQEQRTNRVGGFAWHPDSQRFVFAETLGEYPNFISTIYTFDISTQQLVTLMTINSYVLRMRLSPDGNQLAIEDSGDFHIVDLASLEISTYSLLALVNNINYSPSGGQLMLGFNLFVSGNVADAPLSDNVYVSQSLLGGSAQIIVPDTSPARFNQIATFCNVPNSLTNFDTSIQAESAIETQAQTLLTQLDTLPDNTIPASCEADLRAIAQAIVTEQNSP
jgi:hypothetical protein